VKHQIFFQFISEAVVISLLALGLALGFLVILKPAFLNMKFSQLLQWDLNTEPGVMLLCVLFSVVVGVLAGTLPALLLSSFQPIKVLKELSNIKLFSKIGLRKSLIVIQFAFSLVFIISTTLVYNQLNMMLNANYGFNGENIINVKINDANVDLLKSELTNHSSILNVTATSHLPAAGTSYGDDVRINPEDEEMEFNYFSTDENYIENMGLKLIAGNNFKKEDVRTSPDKLIINTKMVGMLGFESPNQAINETIIVGDSIRMTIAGVVEDYNHEALLVEIGPMALIPKTTEHHILQVKYQNGNRDAAVNHLETSWSKINPSKKVTYQEFSEEVKGFYDLMFGDLVNIIGLISFLTITISCLGLLGMATFTTQTKVKEISIRKVLGASDKNVILMLSKGFIMLLIIATVIALPIAYFVNNMWLQSLAYRVNINFSVIGLCTGIMFLLGIIVIGSQTIKASMSNPAEQLRSE
ncbi:MAG: FtsX-like permease family protein, partial [Fulvivirga sp.]